MPILTPASRWTLAVEIVTVRPHLGMVGLKDDVLVTRDAYEGLTTIGRHLHVVAV